MPDSTGNGYWLVTNLGPVYAFGDAADYGEPPTQSGPAVDAVATPDGHGYWVLYANGAVFGFGDAAGMAPRRVRQLVQPGRRHLPDRGRQRLLGGRGPG